MFVYYKKNTTFATALKNKTMFTDVYMNMRK